jgi:transcriptional regulator with XRE-family HTH domain
MGDVMSNIASGRQLRAARTLAGLTQSELSTEAGFNPRAATLEAIEAVLWRYGVELFVSPTPGCRFISAK